MAEVGASDVNDSPAASGAPPAEDPKQRIGRVLGLPLAHVAGWAVVAFANVLATTFFLLLPERVVDRIVHHAVGTSHLLGLGLVSCVAIGAWQRWARRRSAISLAVAFAVAAAILFPAAAEDLANFIARHELRPETLFEALGAAAAAASVVAAHVAGERAKGIARWAAAAVGFAIAFANNGFMPYAYPAMHFTIAWSSAALVAGAVSSAARIEAFERLTSEPRRRAAALLAAFVIVALGWLLPVGPVAWRELQAAPGAVVAPYWGRARMVFSGSETVVGASTDPWWRDRSGQNEILASIPPLLPPDAIVLFITIDAMRADALSPETLSILPTIHALAGESVNFVTARSPAPATTTTFASLFTGKYYSQLRWTKYFDETRKKELMTMREDPSPRLFKLLAARGVATSVVASVHSFLREGGLADGFQESFKTKRNNGSAAAVMDLVIARLEREQPGPLFLWAHFIDAHAPYDRAGKQGSPRERYLRELGLVDVEIARLQGAVKARGLEKRTALIVTADHGEAFGEHGMNYHHASVYDELLRVPLIVHLPENAPRRAVEPVAVLDLTPTILDLFGAPIPGAFMGESLVPALRGAAMKSRRPIAAESGRGIQAMVFPDGKKAIFDGRRGTEEVFDLHADPGELRNLAGDAAVRDRYIPRLRSFFAVHAGKTPSVDAEE